MTLQIHLLLPLVAIAGCGAGQQSLEIRLRSPTDPTLLDNLDTFVFSAEDSRGLTLRRFDAAAASLRLDDIPWGSGITFRIEGLFHESAVVRGRSCPTDVVRSKALPVVSMFISRIGSFAPAEGPPGGTRVQPLAIPLLDGTALVAGGATMDVAAVATVERFDPRTGTWTGEAGLKRARRGGESAHYGDRDDALVVGGVDENGAAVTTVEVYRKGQGFRALPGDPGLGRVGLRATTLPDGRVLVTGGAVGGGPATADAAVFDGSEFRPAGKIGRMFAARRGHSVSVLPAGTFSAAFVIGGDGGAGAGPLATIELYNPLATAGSEFTIVETASLSEPRTDHTATVLSTGGILIVGGRGVGGAQLDVAEIFDTMNRTVRSAEPLMQPRVGHTATLLSDGRVLVAGGTGADGFATRSAEIFDPSVGVRGGFVPARDLTTERTGHVALPLCDGTVLLVGGGAGAEIYNPAR